MSKHPNIRTRADEHRSGCLTVTTTNRYRDVRRCPHGRAQVVRVDQRGWWWADLSPVWTPVQWFRARRALFAAQEPAQ